MNAAIILSLMFVVAIVIVAAGTLIASPAPPRRLLRTPRVHVSAWNAKPGEIVIAAAGERFEYVQVAKPWADRRCRYCRRVDGARASDGSCAGCGSRDFDDTEPARRPSLVIR